MSMVFRFFQSSLGKKYVMAGTGFVLFCFVVVHMLGNLQAFLGAKQLNTYAYYLQANPELLWGARLGLLIMVLLHILAALKLSAENRAARPEAYGECRIVAASYASRTMLMSGLIIAAFVVYHLLHFTVQNKAINLTGQDFKLLEETLSTGQSRHDVYRMMVIGFSNPWVSFFYVLSIGLLCLHLSHGVSSMFQSLGWKNRRYGKLLDGAALVIAIVLFAGYISLPVAVLTGGLK